MDTHGSNCQVVGARTEEEIDEWGTLQVQICGFWLATVEGNFLFGFVPRKPTRTAMPSQTRAKAAPRTDKAKAANLHSKSTQVSQRNFKFCVSLASMLAGQLSRALSAISKNCGITSDAFGQIEDQAMIERLVTEATWHFAKPPQKRL